MTPEEARERNKELDELSALVGPMRQAALEARDSAQEVLDVFSKFWSEVRRRQIANFESVRQHLDDAER